MSLIRKSILVIFTLLSISAFAQNGDFTLLKSIQGDFDMISTDEFGSLYAVQGNMLKKFNRDGKVLSNYSNYLAGDISFVDSGDPFKILIYYQEFSQVETLDNTLSPVNKIELTKLGYDLASLACASYQSGFWIYNPPFAELIRFDQYLEVTDRTGNLFKATGVEVNPNYMIERDNIIYLNNPDFGIMIFDKYGSYFRTIAVKDLNNFQLLNKMLVVNDTENIRVIDPENLEENIIELPEKNVLQAKLSYLVNDKRMYLLTKNGIQIYSVQ